MKQQKIWVGFNLAVGLLLATAGPGTALAQTAEATEGGFLVALDDVEGVRLSLAEVLRRTLENNLDLVSARHDPQISEQRVEQELATFDTGFESAGQANGFETEPSDEFTSAGVGQNIALQWGKVTREFQFGGSLEASLSSNQRTGAGSNFFLPSGDSTALVLDASGDPILIDPGIPELGFETVSVLDPGLDEAFYSSSMNLVFNTPLLRNRGKIPNTELLELARGDLDASREELRRQAELTIEAVEGAYWDLLASYAELDVAKQSLKRAGDLLELNRKKVEVGTLAPIEITQAEAGVASQKEGVILAEVKLENAADELRRLLAVPWDDPLWDEAIIPTDRPTFEPQAIDLDQAIESALQHRPELASARQGLRNTQLSERAKRNRTKHGLDLNLRFTPVGNNFLVDELLPSGPSPNDPTRTAIFSERLALAHGDLSDSFEEMFEFDFFDWSASVVYTLPIGNRQAKGAYRIATLNRQKSEIGLANQELTIRVDVRRAVRGVQSGAQRVTAARTNIRLQKQKLDAEQKKFENGMSTSFEVLTFQNDLADAELSGIQAVLDYTKALAALERSKGTLLEARGLHIAGN